MRKRNKIASIVLASALVLTGMGSASAATYTSYALKPLQQNNATSYHTKSTNNQYITNKVTALSNTTAANFWAETDGADMISSKYTQRVSSTYTTINFTQSGVNSGDNVRLAMENNAFNGSNAFVSGDVYFQ